MRSWSEKGNRKEVRLKSSKQHEPKFFKIDAPIFIAVKHSYHHLHRMAVKLREISIHQCPSELAFCELACPRLVDGFEEREQGGIVRVARWGRRTGWA